MKLLLIILSVSILQACAKKDGGGSDPAPQKSLWSSWTRTDGAISVNLTGGKLNQSMAIGWALGGGVNCVCNLTMTGSEASGSWSMSGCAGGSSCSALNGSGTFNRVSNTQLMLCDSTCGSYQ